MSCVVLVKCNVTSLVEEGGQRSEQAKDVLHVKSRKMSSM